MRIEPYPCHSALDVSVCVDDEAGGGADGFYLLTLKGSPPDGLTGVKGSMVRKVVEQPEAAR